jgi:uncharacterized protein YwqG
MVNEQISDLIQSVGLSHHAAAIQSLVRNTINVRVTPEQQGQSTVGRSRFGGWPDLPQSMNWPVWNNEPLTFIGQFRMTETAPYDSDGDLPQTGWLYFFYEANEQQVWGFDPDGRGAWRVLYYGGPASDLCPRHNPKGLEDEFPEAVVEFSKGVSLPSWESAPIMSLNLTEDERDAYNELLDKLAAVDGDGPACHQLLGHPKQIQRDMQLECQLVSHGVYCGDLTGYESSLRAELEEGAKDWRLLLQVDSDDNTGMMWCDSGRIFYWIRQDDLRAKSFENTWFVLQCY